MVDMKLSFDPATVEHLGYRMYSHLPNALAELVANSYDADATAVTVTVTTRGAQSVEVADDGHGMSPEDLAERYLRIGRNRRVDDAGTSESGRRKVAGKKGLGKLAPFGIGTRVTVRTKRAGAEEWTVVALDWNDLKNSRGEYRPATRTEPGQAGEHGTVISIEEMTRKTRIDVAALAASLSRLFNYVGDDFSLTITRAGSPDSSIDVTRQLRYSSIAIETTWRLPEDLPGLAPRPNPAVRGVIYASVKPLPQEMRGLTLYIHGRLANEPEYFGVPESSYAFSYLTGYIDADHLDELDEDVISTDRRSVSWDQEDAAALRDYVAEALRLVGRLRRSTRRIEKEKRLRREFDVDPEAWAATIQGPEAGPVQEMLTVLISPDSEMSDDDRETIVLGMREIAPEYADLHWRHIHPSIQEASGSLYRSKHYFHAVLEAIKQYVADVRTMSGVTAVDLDAIHQALGKNRRLDIFSRYLSHGLTVDTGENLRNGQHALSQGVWTGFRNPLSHEQITKLEECGAFSYQDCLDALSIVSHLRRRLDGAAPATGVP